MLCKLGEDFVVVALEGRFGLSEGNKNCKILFMYNISRVNTSKLPGLFCSRSV